MPEEPQPKPKNFDFSGCLWLALIFGLGAVALLIPALRVLRSSPPHANAYARLHAGVFAAALQQYQEDYGVYPEGGNAQLLASIQGGNPRGTIYFVAAPKNINSKGEFIDGWGTPFRIDLSDPKKPRVWSCGRDRIDNGGVKGSDDLISELPDRPKPQ
jgi:hypothetical protein